MTSSPSPKLIARIERWPIAGAFTISRGAKTEAITVVVEVSQGGYAGRGECVPYARYGETPEATLAALLSIRKALGKGLGRQALQGSGFRRSRSTHRWSSLNSFNTVIHQEFYRLPAEGMRIRYSRSLRSPDPMSMASAPSLINCGISQLWYSSSPKT